MNHYFGLWYLPSMGIEILTDITSFQTGELLLIVVGFFIALFNASVGPTGGLSFAVFSAVLPPAAVVPLHAVVSGGSTLSRAFIFRDLVDHLIVIGFIAGGIVGFGFGAGVFLLWKPPDDVLRLILGGFILTNTIAVRSENLDQSAVGAKILGGYTSFLCVFVGATGPLVTASLARNIREHRTMLATQSVCMCFQHASKILFFGAVGFSFGSYATLLVVLLTVTVLGTWLGRLFLNEMYDAVFSKVCRVITAVLGLSLIVRGFVGSDVMLGSGKGLLLVGIVVILGVVVGRRIGEWEPIAHLSTHFGKSMFSGSRSHVAKATPRMLVVVPLIFAIPMAYFINDKIVKHKPVPVPVAVQKRALTKPHDALIAQIDNSENTDISKQRALLERNIQEASYITHREHIALEKYKSLLARDPGNTNARQGLESIVSDYVTLAKEAEAAGDMQALEWYLDKAYSVLLGTD